MTDMTPEARAAEPGKAEAEAIAADYAEAMSGAKAWVRMGLRLILIKKALPHGGYRAWCEEHLSNVNRGLHLSPMHLANAKRVAEDLLQAHGVQLLGEGDFEALPIWDDLEGKSQRQLITECRERRADDTEEANQLWCEARWAEHPALRDEWEERVLAGELSYTAAAQGMRGRELTEGVARSTGSPARRLLTNAGGLTRNWTGWEQVAEAQQDEIIDRLSEALRAAPERVRLAIRNFI